MSDALFIGLMSGTSMDGIDSVLVRYRGDKQEILGHCHIPWPDGLRQELRDLCEPREGEIDRMGQIDVRTGKVFAHAVEKLLQQCDTDRKQVTAIGSHGQTVRHRPNLPSPFTLQIGDPNVIAEQTGITVVADFRRRDIAAGGEGAPLVPAFHEALFRTPSRNRVILNIGGIANITILPGDAHREVFGFDTGPGNTLIDYWVRHQRGIPLDRDGAWAATGSVDERLLQSMLEDDYFGRAPPKSTGPEYFGPAWLSRHLSTRSGLPPENVQATLTALTARSIATAISTFASDCGEVICCGGGAHNRELIGLLRKALGEPGFRISSEFGVDPELVEAAAFAWMARETLAGRPGNLPGVTGATHPVILGAIYQA